MKMIIVWLFLIQLPVWASEALEVPSFQDVELKVRELRSKYSARDILIVLDIDNTLLRANQSLGSDQWFEWQNEAITKGTAEASFKSVDELFKAQANYYQLSSMSLTDASLPQITSALQTAGHHMFLLTSRSPILRNVTERELKRNKLWFSQSSPMPGIPEEFQVAPFKNPVSFMNGIFMTAGHHKGEALDYLMRRSGRRYKAVVFVDDLERHTKRVYDLLSAKPNLEVLTFRYSKEDPRVETFRSGPKSLVQQQARELAQYINRTFVTK